MSESLRTHLALMSFFTSAYLWFHHDSYERWVPGSRCSIKKIAKVAGWLSSISRGVLSLLLRNIAAKFNGLNSNSKKAVGFIIKLTVVSLAAIFIWHRLSDNENLHNFNRLLKDLTGEKVFFTLAAVFLLMVLNWFLEALKWKFLVRDIERITVWRAVESVFCGLTWAVFTPNRIGEYGGRVFFLAPRRRVLGVIAMAVGAVGQMVVTNVLGAFAIWWFIWQFMDIGSWLDYALFLLAFFFSLFFLLFYFNIASLIALLERVRFLRRFRRFFLILKSYRKSDLLTVFYFCVARFVVFTAQYCLIITMLISDLPVFPIIMMTLILFFIQSALPSLDVLDIGVRTMTATYFFSFITQQEVAIMASTASIWLVNLIIPAILGAVFVFKLNFFGTTRS